MEKKDKDISILVEFLKVYCRECHNEIEKIPLEGFDIELCEECIDLANYSIKRRQYCKKNPKPSCKKCDTPCYGSPYRENIREVMKFSGKYLIKKGRVDYLLHFLF